MKLKDLLKKVNQANKLNEELAIGKIANLVLVNKYSTSIRIYNTKDIKKITDYYIDEISNAIIKNDLVKAERYLYKIVDTEFEIAIELN